MAWMYIVRCCDGSFYTGSTRLDPEQRAWEHNNDDAVAANYTRKRRPVTLVHWKEYADLRDAFAREKQVQGWSRAKKQAMIDGRYGDLPDLSRSHASTGSANEEETRSASFPSPEPVEGNPPHASTGSAS